MTVMDMHKYIGPQSLLICECMCFQSIATDVWNQTPGFAKFVKKLESFVYFPAVCSRGLVAATLAYCNSFYRL